MKRKWLALVLAGTLVLGTLAGCGNSGSGQKSSGQEEPSDQGRGVKRRRGGWRAMRAFAVGFCGKE